MPLFRLLIITLVIGVGFYIYRRLTMKPPPPTNSTQVNSTHAVKCALCGLHVPDDEAIRRNNQTYCCQDHADKSQP